MIPMWNWVAEVPGTVAGTQYDLHTQCSPFPLNTKEHPRSLALECQVQESAQPGNAKVGTGPPQLLAPSRDLGSPLRGGQGRQGDRRAPPEAAGP